MRTHGLATQTIRLRVAVRGAVQGVGFRPFVFRLARELGLAGWVNNSTEGVFLEAEGAQPRLEEFLLRLESEKPPRSVIQSLEASWLDAAGFNAFEIRPSETGGARTTLVLPDIATCPDCLREIFDPANRRHRYPFTNCTNCGPRFSIIEALPYDRANTSMKRFTMCPACQSEYDDPRDRRFHAQPNACPVCGPRLELWGRDGKAAASPGAPALEAAARALREGKIVAVKGMGGFHLMAAARDDGAMRRLRERKHREEKPFAVMVPSLAAARDLCRISPAEERLLRSPEAPIVLLESLSAPALPLSNLIAPRNPNLGVLLPYTPLHHLLLAELGFPVVATSGNLSDEPICIDEHEAVERLGGIADVFLVHDRPIVRHVDDSITRVMAGRELVLRRARGYAPLPIPVNLAGAGASAETCVLAVGAHLKNSIALSVGPRVFLSQHIGDLETDQAYRAFQRVVGDFQTLYQAAPAVVAADAHPDYLSTRFAREQAGRAAGASGRPFLVQHHAAHVLSCMAENELTPPLLGVSWDGTGYGLDGTVWGGEFFLVTETDCARVAHLRRFRLPGGDKAVKEPRRTALGLLYELFGEAVFEMKSLAPAKAFSTVDLAAIRTMLARGINSPLTSSAGRLFDAVASILGLRQQVRFEGQAAMELEFCAETASAGDAYEFAVLSAEPPGSVLTVDWSPAIRSVLSDLGAGVAPGRIAARFHNGLAEAILAVARRVKQERVALSGGCFQNRYLAERTILRLSQEGFRPYWQQRVPPNDGGIALGQVMAVLRGYRSADIPVQRH